MRSRLRRTTLYGSARSEPSQAPRPAAAEDGIPLVMVAPGILKPLPLDHLRHRLYIWIIDIDVLLIQPLDDNSMIGDPFRFRDICAREPIGQQSGVHRDNDWMSSY